jgi:hypothetical protein
MDPSLRCPTCRAPWRGAPVCPRCGADLALLMRLAVKAWQLREEARTALWAGGRPAEAVALARAACQLHETERGQGLLTLALLAAGQWTEASVLLERVGIVKATPS